MVACGEAGIVDRLKVKLGDRVAKDQVLVELDMSVLEAARRVATAKASGKARLAAAEVEFSLKSQRYQKLSQLYQEGAGSPEEASKARGAAEVARQDVEATLEAIDQSRLETEQIDAQIERRRIRSPIDGVVVELTRKQGEYISTSEPHIATVVSLDQLKAVFYLPTKIATEYQNGDQSLAN
jgi:RND family efflux transporter MFP subunit